MAVWVQDYEILVRVRDCLFLSYDRADPKGSLLEEVPVSITNKLFFSQRAFLLLEPILCLLHVGSSQDPSS